MELDKLVEVLEFSVKKNGEKPLTNKWLLDLLKIAQMNLAFEDETWYD